MITKELNERLTQTTPGTPGGNLLRRYWWPIGALSELEKEPVQPVRLLGENLTLFRTAEGPGARGQGTADGAHSLSTQSSALSTRKYGLIAERCAHRAISLSYGIPQENGLRCAYHGWTYDTEGHVIDMPFEPACLPLKVTSYPVEELGGLVWAYLGPEPRPLHPRWQGLVASDLIRTISFKPLPCNWVQCMDNSMDPVHFEHLHGYYGDYYYQKHGMDQRIHVARHLKIDFDVFEYGIYKRRLTEADPEDADDWTTGHPIVFPYTLVQGPGTTFSYQMRVPMDDTHTMHTVLLGRPRKDDEAPQEAIPVRRLQVMYDEYGRVDAPQILMQDEMAWIGQGPVSDRTIEHPVTSDKGVVLFHHLLLENIEKVERGQDPMGVIRDPAQNEPYISFRRESASNKTTWSGAGNPDARDTLLAWTG